MPGNNIHLLASYWTISGGIPHTDKEYSPHDFKDRVEAAARAGFKGVGIWHSDLEHVLRRRSLREKKAIRSTQEDVVRSCRSPAREACKGWRFLSGENAHAAPDRSLLRSM